MNSLKYLVSREFLFYINPVRFETADKIFFAVVVLALAAFVGLYIAGRYHKVPAWKRFLKQLSLLSLWFGLVGLVWAGCRYELVPWFGTHFAFLVVVLVGGVWKSVVVWRFVRSYKSELADWHKTQTKEKYLAMSSK